MMLVSLAEGVIWCVNQCNFSQRQRNLPTYCRQVKGRTNIEAPRQASLQTLVLR
jgi:hypothetical protein